MTSRLNKCLVAALLVWALASSVSTFAQTGENRVPSGSGSIDVRPFVNLSPDPADAWIGAGIAEAIRADLVRAGTDRETGTSWFVRGAYQRVGTRLRITATLVKRSTGETVDTVMVDGEISDLFALQDEVAVQLAVSLEGNDKSRNPGVANERDVVTSSEQPDPSGVGLGTAIKSPPTPPPPSTNLELASQMSLKVVNAISVEDSPTLDGDVLGDPVWNAVDPVSGFRQSAPDEGEPATERTEIRIVFTDDTIFFGIVCYDRDPSSVIVSDSRRDSSMNDADSFQMVLDTFSDRQNGFVFGTTPAGQEYDGQVINEGGGRSLFGGGGRGGFSRGSGGGFNLNWDGAWQVRTAISDVGWSAEFAIPFRTIRYPAREGQLWGVNFQRNIRRRNETAYWAPLPRQYNLYRVSMAGQLTGVTAPIGFTGNLQLTPYVVGEMLARDAAPDAAPLALGDFGADLKYSVTSGLTLDATYNTDFAQVEVDDQQINLDRFNLFFPEKRPFFLENAGVFTVGNQGPASGMNLGQTELFFSRRIGINDAGGQIPILGGARLSGKVSDAVTVGFINMQTEAVDGIGMANNFTVARLRRDLPNRSSVGGLFVNRQATGEQALGNDYNRSYAVDGRWGIGQNGLVQGFAGRTETPGRTGRDHALSVSTRYDSETWRLISGYQENGEDFNPEVGFIRRTGGFRKFDFGVNNTSRPEGFLKFQELQPHMSFTRFWNLDGIMETSFLHLHFQGEFADSSSAGVAYDVRSEAVFDQFKVSGIPVPPGRYDFNEVQYSYNYNRSAPVSFGMRTTVAGFFGGDIVTVRPSIRARYGEIFNLSFSYSRNDIDLPNGSVITNLASVRAGYNFSPRLFAQALLQHNDSADIWSVNFRVGWVQDANTGLFLVYNETEGLGGVVPSFAGRSVILKYSYLFDVLD